MPRRPADRVDAPPAAAPAAAEPTGHVTSLAEAERFGRVADDGTVFVQAPDGGEREVGSYPGASPQEALAYFARKYDEVLSQVDLFVQRLTSTDVPPGEIDTGTAHLREPATDLHAVGDLAALDARVAEAHRAGEAAALAGRRRAVEGPGEGPRGARAGGGRGRVAGRHPARAHAVAC
nr:hypothetical protein [Angustibacter aerolatus]